MRSMLILKRFRSLLYNFLKIFRNIRVLTFSDSLYKKNKHESNSPLCSTVIYPLNS